MIAVLDATVLQSPADRLRRELSALIESNDEMQTRTGPFLTARYQAALGRLELQLLKLQIEIRSVRRRVELLQSGINRGEPATQEGLADNDAELDRLRLLVLTHADRLSRLKTEPPHSYAGSLMDDIWVAVRQAELAEAIAVESGLLAQLLIRQAESMAHLGISPGGRA